MYQTVHTSNALVGTCKMGPKGDNLSVVGGDLRVHGLKGKTNKIKSFLAFCDIAVQCLVNIIGTLLLEGALTLTLGPIIAT